MSWRNHVTFVARAASSALARYWYVWQARFWMWLYRCAQARLPSGYYDEVFMQYVAENLRAVAVNVSPELAWWLVRGEGRPDEQRKGRETRRWRREVRGRH